LANNSSNSFRGILGLSLLLLLVVASIGTAEAATLQPKRRNAGSGYVGFLTAQGTWFVDQSGNVAVLRGANFFGYEYGWLDSHTEADYAKMASWGFNIVRLPISWHLIEPEPNRYDDTYLHSTVDRDLVWAEKYGIHIIIDMHQYGWSPHFKWFDAWTQAGLPLWAVSEYNDNLAGEGQARADFWNGLGPNGSPVSESNPSMQDRFFAMWQHVARRYSNSTVVAGYDIFNEPYSYSVDYKLCPDDLWTVVPKVLATFYAKSIDSIRVVDPIHICFWEAPSDYPNRPNVAYSPHYPGQDDFQNYDAVKVRSAVEKVMTSSRAWNVPVFMGEWGMLASAADVATYIRDFSDLMDKYLISATWWSYGKGGFQMYLFDQSGNERVALTQNLIRPYLAMSSKTPSSSSYITATKEFRVYVQGPCDMRMYILPFRDVTQASVDSGAASTSWPSVNIMIGVSVTSSVTQLTLAFA
jgi:endoglycosylceramidase